MFDSVKQVAPSYIFIYMYIYFLHWLKSFNNLHYNRLKHLEIQYNCTMYCIGFYFERICSLIDKELRNLTSSKLLKFIMQDLSKIRTCIISLQEATNHWLLLQLSIFKRIQSTQVNLKLTPKNKKNTSLLDKNLRTASICINFLFVCFFFS